MQSSSRSRSFKPGLIGASPITDAILLSRCNQFCTPLCEGGSSWCKSTWERHFQMQSAEFRMQNDCSSSVLVHFALCILHTFKCRVQNSECRMAARQASWFILHSAFST